MPKQLVLFDPQPEGLLKRIWWNVTHLRMWWRGETIRAAVQEVPRSRSYGWNEPIPCREVGPLHEFLAHVADEHEPDGLFSSGGRCPTDGDGLGYDPYD